MTRMLLGLVFSLVILPNASHAAQFVYLSSGDQLTVYALDGESGELKVAQEVGLPSAGPLGVNRPGTLMYAVSALTVEGKRRSAIATFQIQSDGKLKRVAIEPVNLRPGYLMTDSNDRFITGNHYGPGKITVWGLQDAVFRGKMIQEIEVEQKAHSTVFSPNGNWLLVPTTGPNKVYSLRLDDDGKLAEKFASPGPQAETAARQPRHLIFHPKLDIAYTSNERERPGVGVWRWDETSGKLQTIQNIVTQPDDFDGFITTADLHLTPDARFLYLSNRDTSKRGSKSGRDSIVCFHVKEDGTLELKGHTPCEHIPRSFCLDEKGKYVFVAGQGDDHLGVYRISAETGGLKKVTSYKTGARPSWVHCMTPPGHN